MLPPTARRSRLGVLFCPRPDGTADMHIVINGEDMGPSARGLPATQPLYTVVDVFASTKSVRLIQLEYGCRYPILWAATPPGPQWGQEPARTSEPAGKALVCPALL